MDRLEELQNLAEEAKKLNQLKTPQQYIDELTDSYTVDENPLTMTFSSFDEVLRHKLRGKLAVFVGKGGSKKSMFAQQISRANAQIGHSTIYSTMEMPATQLVERLLDMTLSDDENNFYGFNASYYFEREHQAGNKEVGEILKKALTATFGDKFWINQKSRMQADDFRQLIEKHNKENDTPASMLIVDGLSMMGGTGNETEDYTTNSGQLKDLANEFNIFIALICHVTKGCKKHTRNPMDYIRGSEKILDNCDFIVQTSLCQDEQTMNDQGDCEYKPDIGYIRLFDKRGSGKTVNRIYDFNSQQLEMKENNLIHPNSVEVKSDKKSDFF